MVIIDKTYYCFNFKELHFCREPFDVEQCDGVRFICCNNKACKDGFCCLPANSAVIDLTQDLDTIWLKFDKSCRRKINRAPREGVNIKTNQGYEDFYAMYKSLSQKKGFESMGMWDVTLETMKKYGTIFLAEYQGEDVRGPLY
jgi:hypothetical protein